MLTELTPKTLKQLLIENEELRASLAESKETLDAIRNGEVDAIIVSGLGGEKIFSISSAETPYRVIIEEMNEGAVVLSADGVVLYCNRRFAELVSISPEQIIGSWFSQFFPKNDIQKYNDLLQAGLKGKTEGELTYIKDDNTHPIHLHLSFSPLPAELLGDVCIMAADISELKQKEEELRRSHETLERQVIERTAELAKTVEELANSQRAAVKMMDDAIEAKNTLDILNKELAFQNEEKEKRAEELILANKELAFQNEAKVKREAELIKSESRFRSYVEATGQIAWVTNANGEIEEDVPSLRKYTGQSYDEAKGSGWVKALHPDDIEHNMQIWNKALTTKSPYETEYRICRYDSVYRHVIARGFPVFKEDGNIIEWVGTCIDITERKHMEGTLRETNAYLQNLLNYANAPIIVWDTKYKITRFNKAFESLTGRTEKEVLGKPLEILFPSAQKNYSMELIRKTLEGERLEVVEIDILDLNGKLYKLLWNSANVMSADRKTVLSTIAQGQDITGRKLVEIKLRDEKQRLRTILDQIGDPIFVKDNNHCITLANQAFYDIFCLDEKNVIGYTLAEAVRENERQQFLEVDRRVLDTGIPDLREEELTVKGLTRSIITRKTRFIDEEGNRFLVGSIHDITGRKQAEEALLESEIRFRLLFENMVEGVALHEMIYDDTGIPYDYRILDVNSSFEKQTGISGKSARGKLATVLYGVETPPYLVEYSGVVLSGNSISFESYFPNLKKTFSVSAISTKTGCFATIFQNITERKRAEERLKASEEKFLKAFQNSPNAIIISRVKDGKIIEVNDSFSSMSGITRNEAMLGSTISLNLWANIEDRNWVLSALKDGIEVKNKEFLFTIKNGNHITGLYSAQVIHLTDEPCVLSSILDITERTLAEQSLLQSEKKFSDIVKHLDEGYYSVTMDGILLEHNLAFNRILGIDINRDMKGEKSPDFWQNQNTRTHYLKELMAKGSIKNYEVAAKTLSGERITVVLNSHLIKDNDGKLLRIEGIVLDITERKRAEEEILELNKTLEQKVFERTKQLEYTNKELEAFSYSVSHDLRAPLRHIGGFIDLLFKNNSNQLNESGLRYLKMVSESSHEMGKLIDALLTFSRLGRTGLQRTKFNTKNVVTDVIKTFDDELAGRNIEINISELPETIGDEVLFNQVWANLISNALKYSQNKEKAVIDIGGSMENDKAIFYIKDNGAGFDMKYADKLFGVFQRMHKARDFEGIGIGLANVKRIITRHGGNCWAESEVDKGATFFFSVPN